MEHEDVQDGCNTQAEARLKIQEIIDSLHHERLNLADPKNTTVDERLQELDNLFKKHMVSDGGGDLASSQARSVNVCQAKLDIEAFSLLTSINHLRIRAVTASSWSFRAADFASRMVKILNTETEEQSEVLTTKGKSKLNEMTRPYLNCCTPLRPLLGAICMSETETVPRERRQRQKKAAEEQPASQQPKKVTDISEEDQNTKVAKHVEFIMRCLKKEYDHVTKKKPVSFYHFVVDPKSFSNTVENIFYVSFLIKDGFVALREENGLPVLDITSKGLGRHDESLSQQLSAKKQLIIAMDVEFWEELVEILHLDHAKIDQELKNRHVHKRPRQH